MSNCTNCFNGCTEIVSDRCVKYTGIDIPALGITTGDTLSHVEESIINFLVPVLNGSGIKPLIDDVIICNVVRQYLPTCTICTGFTLNEVITAIIKAACNLQQQIDSINSTLTILNADYTIGCLTGVTASSDTHAIVQAVINKVCSLEVDIVALALDLETNYVKIADLNTYIAAYLASIGTSTKYYNRMIPYAVVEYYGPIGGNFDATGAGITSGNWEKIYLCNGQNGTPDKRGKVGVGTTDGSMLGLALPSNTNPASSTFNPTYTLGGTAGSNQVTLTASQLPSHTHLATAVSTATPHTHNTIAKDGSSVEHSTSSAFYNVGNTWSNSGIAVSTDTGIDDTIVSVTTTVTNNQTGGDLAHSNVQVGLGCYYIQYRP